MTAAALAILIAHDHAVVRRELPNGSARRPAPSREVRLLGFDQGDPCGGRAPPTPKNNHVEGDQPTGWWPSELLAVRQKTESA